MIFIPWSYVLTALGFIGWGGPVRECKHPQFTNPLLKWTPRWLQYKKWGEEGTGWVEGSSPS